ncbi:MAG: MOSC domain-containing protein [Actinomycetia bacterium]|nr:MOSC domain-containing protein [Actinomycetes bacterium]
MKNEDYDPPSGTWTRCDQLRTVANLAGRIRQVLAGVDEALATFAVRDELDHLERHIRAAARLLVVAGSGGGQLDGGFADQLQPLDPDAAPPDASTLAARIAGFAERLPGLIDQAGGATVSFRADPMGTVDAGQLLEMVVAEGEWSLHRLGRLRATAADGPGPGSAGVVESIHVSDGGVPKLPIPSAAIVHSGVVGDRQATRTHHGRPWQAVSLWSADVIDDMASEGHPIGPGKAGENLTLRGLDWKSLRPGVQLGFGGALIELTAWAEPCQQIADLFVDGCSWWIDHDRYPGRARIYGRVIRPGPLEPGDPVVIEPNLE